MDRQRTLTIGITVNLENYENLRLEVSGAVESEEDAKELALFLDRVLGMFGRSDPASRERIDGYRKRILPPGAAEYEAIAGPVTTANQGLGTGSDQPVAVSVPERDVSPEKIPGPGAPDQMKVATCEECGAPVKPADQKMSMLFASRTLCRKCLKNI
ncbi:MAG: hypothetical protein NQU46_07110 [Methanolinea sp.]|nr:hypothetical protein [Methanolinea sp.]